MMRKMKTEMFIILAVMLTLIASVSLAEKGDMDCPNCGYTRGTYTYIRSYTVVVGDCPYTIDCQIKRRVSIYDWHCDTCGYGGGAHGKDEIYEYHTNSDCTGRYRMIQQYVRIRNGDHVKIEMIQ